MILGVVVQDGHELTDRLIQSLKETVDISYPFQVVIFDNNSTEPYDSHANSWQEYPFRVSVCTSDSNVGYYAPLKLLADIFPDENLVGLAHNDMVIYEQGWNARMESCFDQDPKLALVGFCGSYEVDERGGRGGGTHVMFRGAPGYQSPAAGARYPGLVASACLDSLFMTFSREGIEALQEDWANLPLAHFYDRIWPLRLVQKGYHVGTLGVECDHMGGMTTVANPRYRDDCIKWLNSQNIPFENPETEMYLEAERRYFKEFKDTGFIPCKINPDYSYERVGL